MYMDHVIKILVTCMHDDIFYKALTLATQEMINVILDKNHISLTNMFLYTAEFFVKDTSNDYLF